MIEVLKAGKVRIRIALYGKCPSCGCIFRCTSSDIDRDRYVNPLTHNTVACPMPNCDTYVPVEWGDEDGPLHKESTQ